MSRAGGRAVLTRLIECARVKDLAFYWACFQIGVLGIVRLEKLSPVT
jgi:hypothetical protein